MGTVKQVVGGMEEAVERTTPEAIDLQDTFRRMLEAGDGACAMEVSSHALELGRAAGIRFAARVFTNLTQDHLDFHPTMEEYFLAKRRLFDGPGPAIVNADDDYGRRLAAEVPGATTFAIDNDADYRARDVRFDVAGATFTVATPDGPLERDHAPAWPVQRVERAGRARHGPRAGGEAGGGGSRAGAGGARARPLRARRGGAGLRRARRLRPHPGLARQRAACRPRADHGHACTWCSAPAATATGASGR